VVGVPEMAELRAEGVVIGRTASRFGQWWPKKEFIARNGTQLMSELMSEDD
jgi:hypothetical protein